MGFVLRVPERRQVSDVPRVQGKRVRVGRGERLERNARSVRPVRGDRQRRKPRIARHLRIGGLGAGVWQRMVDALGRDANCQLTLKSH